MPEQFFGSLPALPSLFFLARVLVTVAPFSYHIYSPLDRCTLATRIYRSIYLNNGSSSFAMYIREPTMYCTLCMK